jgi:hypothetical protein
MANGINDLVSVCIDNRHAFFARIENISPDVKPGWWQVKLLVLTLPVQVFTWILDGSQVDGAPFTMGGTPVKLDKVVSPEVPDGEHGGRKPAGAGSSKVVSLFDRKKED